MWFLNKCLILTEWKHSFSWKYLHTYIFIPTYIVIIIKQYSSNILNAILNVFKFGSLWYLSDLKYFETERDRVKSHWLVHSLNACNWARSESGAGGPTQVSQMEGRDSVIGVITAATQDLYWQETGIKNCSCKLHSGTWIWGIDIFC